MSLSLDDVRRIADLARIEITEAEAGQTLAAGPVERMAETRGALLVQAYRRETLTS